MVEPEAPTGALVALISRARARASGKQTPSLQDLIGDAALLVVASLEHQRHWVSKDGQPRSYPEPDFKTVQGALRLQAELCGYLGKLDADTIAAMLQAAGWHVEREKSRAA